MVGKIEWSLLPTWTKQSQRRNMCLLTKWLSRTAGTGVVSEEKCVLKHHNKRFWDNKFKKTVYGRSTTSAPLLADISSSVIYANNIFNWTKKHQITKTK